LAWTAALNPDCPDSSAVSSRGGFGTGGRLRSLHGEAGQFRVLIKHFFLRLFHNDVIAFEEQMKERIIGVLSLLAVFSGLFAYGFLGKYSWTRDTGSSWIEKCALMTLFMLIMGIVAVLEWDVMFLDARDFDNLLPLPVRPRTFLAAKFTSLCFFVGLFALSLNSFSSLFFILLLPRWRSPSFLYGLKFVGVHFLTMSLAVAFAFFSGILLIGVAAALAGDRLFRRISAYLRSLLLLAHVILLVVYLKILFQGLATVVPLDRAGPGGFDFRAFSRYFPPFWFADLYETLLGNASLPGHGRFRFALAGLGLMIIVFFLTMSLSFKKALSGMPSRSGGKTSARAIGLRLFRFFDALALRNPVERAIFHFYRQTLGASTFHKMRLAVYITVGIGLIPFQFAIRELTAKVYLRVHPAMLSSSLIVMFFVVLGLRNIVNVPITHEASWVFRLTEAKNIRHYMLGVKKAIVALHLLPLAGLFFALFSVLWNPRSAAYHSAFLLLTSVLAMEVLFFKSCKIPFACSYLPGKEKIQLYWLVYLLLFLAAVNLMSWMEWEFFKAPDSFWIYGGVVLTVIFIVRGYQRLFFYQKVGIQYDEEPPPVVLGLDYRRPAHLKG